MKKKSKKLINSSGGVVYYLDKDDNLPRFLLLKRYALSKKIEWVAPKWKIMPNETSKDAALREVSEETGILSKNLKVENYIDKIRLYLESEEKWCLNKLIYYYLLHYLWNPEDISIDKVEGYLGIFKWAKIDEVLWLIYYENLREIYRKAYSLVVNSL